MVEEDAHGTLEGGRGGVEGDRNKDCVGKENLFLGVHFTVWWGHCHENTHGRLALTCVTVIGLEHPAPPPWHRS